MQKQRLVSVSLFLIPQWKFLCDIYMNLTDDSEVIISEVNLIKLLRV